MAANNDDTTGSRARTAGYGARLPFAGPDGLLACCVFATVRYTFGMGKLTTAISEAVQASDESAYAIAKGSGVARSQVSRMMRGQSGMTADSIERLADYLELEIVVRPKQRARKAK